MNKISTKSEAIYDIGKRYYQNGISKQKGIELLKQKGVDENNVVDFLYLFSNLMKGEIYYYPFDQQIIELFFYKLNNEYHNEIIKNALFSFTQHIDYYNSIVEKNKQLSKVIFDKYWDIGMPNRTIHPNETGVKTFYVGGVNGIIAKRQTIQELWNKHNEYSKILAQKLSTDINNIMHSYSIKIAKDYYMDLTALKNYNYFADSKNNIYLIKSSYSKKIKIEEMNFDYLLLFIYDNKNNPIYQIEIPLNIVKKYIDKKKHILEITNQIIKEKEIKDLGKFLSIIQYL